MTVFASTVLSLWSAFATPPESARPWCYWWWVNGHTDRQTITADLESMKRLGFGGVLMFDSRGYSTSMSSIPRRSLAGALKDGTTSWSSRSANAPASGLSSR